MQSREDLVEKTWRTSPDNSGALWSVRAVEHDLTCPLREVLVGPVQPAAPLSVLVVATPSDLTATPPDGGPPSCDGAITGYDTVDVVLSGPDEPSLVIDAGTGKRPARVR